MANKHPYSHEPRKRRGFANFLFSILVSVVFLWVVNAYAVWQPWTEGVVTAAWPQVLWAVNLSLLTQIVGNGLLILYRPAWLRRVADLAFSVTGLISVCVVYMVYPIDFGQIAGAWADQVAHVVLGVGILGTTVAVLVNLLRVLSSDWSPGDWSHA